MKSNDDWMKSESIYMSNTSDERAGKTREKPATRDATSESCGADFKHPFFFLSICFSYE